MANRCNRWSDLENRSIGGMLDAMDAEIICFQGAHRISTFYASSNQRSSCFQTEHKARRDNMEKAMAVPQGFDAFFSFPHGKGGYSGTCTYTKQSYAVPVKAEEGITGTLLGTIGGNSAINKLTYTQEERIGGYPHQAHVKVLDNVDGTTFDVKKLDMEGRAVVLDFGSVWWPCLCFPMDDFTHACIIACSFFVLFNLYCPNETNDSRLPYKLNYLAYLEARVSQLLSLGRNVIILGDINVCHQPIDNGEGGIQRQADEHFNHPARQWFDQWLAPSGPMHDVTRQAWPDRKGMFTCWNTKLDARPSNYGARIDYILVSKDLLPWVKHSDIQPQIFGSDHCPVYVDLHESIKDPVTNETLVLKDLLRETQPDSSSYAHGVHRPPLPAALESLRDKTRTVPEPPAFATKWWDEFSGKQTNLMSFFSRPKHNKSEPTTSSTNKKSSSTRVGQDTSSTSRRAQSDTLSRTSAEEVKQVVNHPVDSEVLQVPTGITLQSPSQTNGAAIDLTESDLESNHAAQNGMIKRDQKRQDKAKTRPRDRSASTGLAVGDRAGKKGEPVAAARSSGKSGTTPKASSTMASTSDKGQAKLASFFQPKENASSHTQASNAAVEVSDDDNDARHSNVKTQHSSTKRSASGKRKRTLSTTAESRPRAVDVDAQDQEAQFIIISGSHEEAASDSNSYCSHGSPSKVSHLEADVKKKLTPEQQNQAKKNWNHIFAKKVPPKCDVHGAPCKLFGKSLFLFCYTLSPCGRWWGGAEIPF